MKKLTLLLILTLFATFGCEKLMKEDITLDDPDLQLFSDGLDADIGLSKSSINALNDALNRHGKDGKHRRDPAFLWKVAAELQGKLSSDEKARLLRWMDDNSVPYLFGSGMDGKARGGPQGDKGKLDIRSIYSILDEIQQESLKAIMESYGSKMRALQEQVKNGTLDKDAARAEFEALESAMQSEIEALLTDEQKQKLAEMKAQREEDRAKMAKAAHDAMVNALEMTADQESELETINNESVQAQKALMDKAKAEEMGREDVHEALKQLIIDRNSKIEALFDDKQLEIIKIYTALGMQYSKHCGKKDRDGKDDGGRKG